MPKARSRFSSRHLLAVCTFVVPLGLLAWFGGSTLQRQGEQVQAALEGQALQFLKNEVAPDVEAQLNATVLAASSKAAELLADSSTATATRRLREDEHFPALLDILLLDDEGQLIYPKPPLVDVVLPLDRLPTTTAARRGGRPGEGDQSTAATIHQALQYADVWQQTGDLAAAARLYAEVLAALSEAQVRPLPEYELVANWRLGTLEQKLGRADAGKHLQRARQVIAEHNREWAENAEKQAIDLLIQLQQRTIDKDAEGCLQLMSSIANGDHDLIADGLLAEVQERLLAQLPAELPQHTAATGFWRDDQARQHARLFATDYQEFLRQRISSRLVASKGAPFQQVFTTGGPGSLLWIRPATEAEQKRQGNCAQLCLRFDLSLLLTDVTEHYLKDNGSPFVLAVSDPDDLPLLSPAIEAPADWEAPTVSTWGLRLRAIPSDAQTFVDNARSSAQTRTLLVLGLFLTAIAGAIWLWRSVSREAELAAMKVDLVSRVSHELKTPLALIRMYGETLGLGRAKDAGQAIRFGGIIAREADKLTSLIQRILDFARQQAGTLTYAPEPTALAELLRRLDDAYRPHLQARGAALQCHLEDEVEIPVDAQALEGAIVNLLENAAKYASEESPDRSIDLRLHRQGDIVVIDVLDRGRGVPAAELENIFDSFRRGSNAGEVRGAGLGLSLVRHFARAHGGDVVALARDGGGSIFRLTLPIPPEPT